MRLNTYYGKDDEENTPSTMEERPFYFYENTYTQRTSHFYISSMIDEPHKYVDMIHRLHVANEPDIVFIHINSPGGLVDSGIQIINAMQTSNAQVITSLEGQAASMAALMFLAGDEYVIHDDCMLMLHNYSGAAWGKGHEILQQAQGVSSWLQKMFHKLVVPFVSEEEFEEMMNGKDLWMDSDEVRKRLKAAARVIEEAEMQKEIQKEERKIKRLETQLKKLKEEEKEAKEAEKQEKKPPTTRRKKRTEEDEDV